MNFDRFRHAAHIALAVAILCGLSACASAQADAQRPTVMQMDDGKAAQDNASVAPIAPPAAATPPVADAPRSTVAELQQLIQNRQVAELRTTYNGIYGASLLFKADDLVYYVALFQQKNFWRVLKTSDEKLAESTYRAFAAQSSDLAAVDIRKIKLQALYAHNEKLLATRNNQLSALQADEALRTQQEAQVAAQQEQAGKDAQALADQQRDTAQQLRSLQREIDALQAQQASVSSTSVASAKAKSRHSK